MKVKRKIYTTMEAVRFYRNDLPWPQGVIQEAGDPYVTAFGFGKIPVQDGDWLVYDASNILVITPEVFQMEFEEVREWKKSIQN